MSSLPAPILQDILQACYRANPSYELVLYDRLPAAYQAELSGLADDPDFYGVLWPHAPGLPLKSVDQQTALLFLTLQQPGSLPAYLRARLGEHSGPLVAQLVLDQVLEMAPLAELQAAQEEAPVEPTFVSGKAAYGLIYREPDGLPAPGEGRAARLSLEALRYVEALQEESRLELSARLYGYNSVPASPGWRRRLPGPDAVLEFLGIGDGGANRALLDRHWQPIRRTANLGWLAWHARPTAWAEGGQARRMRYKMYISPLPEVLPQVFGDILDALAGAHVATFKTGADVYGLLRPDKIVAYCVTFEELSGLADHLQSALRGCPAQGVPFTAGIDPDALLSWGMDPPEQSQTYKESWRLWVTNRLAVALLAARHQPAGDMPPWRFALEKLRLEGLDTTTWTPRQAIWQE